MESHLYIQSLWQYSVCLQGGSWQEIYEYSSLIKMTVCVCVYMCIFFTSWESGCSREYEMGTFAPEQSYFKNAEKLFDSWLLASWRQNQDMLLQALTNSKRCLWFHSYLRCTLLKQVICVLNAIKAQHERGFKFLTLIAVRGIFSCGVLNWKPSKQKCDICSWAKVDWDQVQTLHFYQSKWSEMGLNP